MNAEINKEPFHLTLYCWRRLPAMIFFFLFSDDGYYDNLLYDYSADDALPVLPYEYSADTECQGQATDDCTYEYSADKESDSDDLLF